MDARFYLIKAVAFFFGESTKRAVGQFLRHQFLARFVITLEEEIGCRGKGRIGITCAGNQFSVNGLPLIRDARGEHGDSDITPARGIPSFVPSPADACLIFIQSQFQRV